MFEWGKIIHSVSDRLYLRDLQNTQVKMFSDIILRENEIGEVT